jgi:anti-anti-sigma regulatory factor
VLKLVGTIRYASLRDTSPSTAGFQAFLKRCFQWRDYDQVLIDLTETDSIDSTNLGLLAQIARFTLAQWQRRPTLLSTREDINAILESVGFDQVFCIIHELPRQALPELENVPAVPTPEHEDRHTVLEAHRALMAISEKNQAMFKDVVEVLEKQD